MAIINNYTKKKARNAARLARIPNTNKCELFETVRDEDTDNAVEVLRDTTTLKHLNDLINAAQAERTAFMAAYQPQLDKINAKIQNLKDIRTDLKALTGE